jgi:hypothetical protein
MQRPEGRRWIGMLSAVAIAGVALFGPPAVAQGRFSPFDDEFGPYVDPPLALPQQINGLVKASADPRQPERVERIGDVFAALRACWALPGKEAGSGQQMTVRLSFKRNGDLLGRPRITYAQTSEDREARQRFTNSILAAFGRCAPLPFSPSFGAAIAGRPFTFRFVADRRA